MICLRPLPALTCRYSGEHRMGKIAPKRSLVTSHGFGRCGPTPVVRNIRRIGSVGWKAAVPSGALRLPRRPIWLKDHEADTYSTCRAWFLSELP